jgi:predicted transcriptional regulator
MLMPSELVVRFCHKRDREGFDLVDAVAEHFGVSQQAAQIRLSTLSHKLVGDSEEEVPW